MKLISWNLTFKIANLAIFLLYSLSSLNCCGNHCLHNNVATIPTICYMNSLGVKVQNMKMDFNTGDTWRRVGQ